MRLISKAPLITILGASGGLFLLGVIGAYSIVSLTAHGRIHQQLIDVPGNAIGLVPGCPPLLKNGAANRYFTHRIDTAARLFHAGKLSKLVLSGIKSGTYNEPAAMKKSLLARGIPADVLELDYSGTRTMTSISNLKIRYADQKIIIITQYSHAKRAVFLAIHQGLDAHAFSAQDQQFSDTLKMVLREALARIKAVVDVYIMT